MACAFPVLSSFSNETNSHHPLFTLLRNNNKILSTKRQTRKFDFIKVQMRPTRQDFRARSGKNRKWAGNKKRAYNGCNHKGTSKGCWIFPQDTASRSNKKWCWKRERARPANLWWPSASTLKRRPIIFLYKTEKRIKLFIRRLKFSFNAVSFSAR